MKRFLTIAAALLLASCQANDSDTTSIGKHETSAKPIMLDPNAAPDSDKPYQATRMDPVTYDVDFSAVIAPPFKSKILRVWLPLPQTDFV